MSPMMMGQPPLPPEVAQQAPPRRPFDVGEGPGPQAPADPKMDLLKQLGQNIQALDMGAKETAKMVSQIHPPMASFLMPISQGIEALKKEFVELAQRTGLGKGSPEIPAAPPANPGQGPETGAVPPGA